VLSPAQNLTLQGLYPPVGMDPGQWAATVSALRGLRHLKLGLIDDRLLPALSALTSLTLLHLGIRHREDLSPVRCWVICNRNLMSAALVTGLNVVLRASYLISCTHIMSAQGVWSACCSNNGMTLCPIST